MNFEETLRNTWKKVTPERKKLYNWMKKKHLFTASIVEQDFSTISRASIFRTLKLFCNLGILRRVNLGDGAESYEIECCETHHHEHMKCLRCWEVLSFASSKICTKIFTEAKKLGFQISEHSINILWTCKTCR